MLRAAPHRHRPVDRDIGDGEPPGRRVDPLNIRPLVLVVRAPFIPAPRLQRHRYRPRVLRQRREQHLKILVRRRPRDRGVDAALVTFEARV